MRLGWVRREGRGEWGEGRGEWGEGRGEWGRGWEIWDWGKRARDGSEVVGRGMLLVLTTTYSPVQDLH